MSEDAGQDAFLAAARLAGPQPFGLTLCACDLDAADGLAPERARALLSEAEQARAARFRFDRDRDRYLRSAAFVRLCLAALTGTAPAALRFATTGNGKPVLAGAAGLQFNLSHSEGLAVLAVSAAGPVGIDVELPSRRIDAAGLAGTVLTAAEQAAFGRIPADRQTAAFLRFWTAKEARMKLTGEGMALAPRAIELRLDAGGVPAGYAAPARPAARLAFADLGRGGAICAVAVLAGGGA